MVLLWILCAILFSSCAIGYQTNATYEELFIEDIPSIADEIKAIYDEVRPELLYDPFIHIAFADIDFDGTPEFFYGYQTFTGSHNKIWYRAYSLSRRDMIAFEHLNRFDTYILDDTDCAFFTGPNNFIEGYYLNANGAPCFVTKTRAGAVTQIRTDYIFMEYKDETLSVSTGFECAEELHAIKQMWSLTTVENIKEDILALLDKYQAMDDQGNKSGLSSQAAPYSP
jgi:hypothetical protein